MSLQTVIQDSQPIITQRAHIQCLIQDSFSYKTLMEIEETNDVQLHYSFYKFS